MAMNFFNLFFLYISALLVTSLQPFLPPSCLDASPVAAPPGLVLEDKTRLGSTPPSCHNRCKECSPCTAVQVPTFPVRDRRKPGLGDSVPLIASPQPMIDNKYANYKPLGWKCRCADRLFDP